MVLHQELEVLRRQVDRPTQLPADRALFAAAAHATTRDLRCLVGDWIEAYELPRRWLLRTGALDGD